MTSTAETGPLRRDDGSFARQSDTRLTIDHDEWSDRSLQVISKDQMKMTNSGGWTAWLSRKGSSGSTDGGSNRDASLPGEDAAGPKCTSKNACAVLKTKRETTLCKSGALVHAFGNKCDEAIKCNRGIYYDKRYHGTFDREVKPMQKAEYGPFCTTTSCGCSAPSSAQWKYRCSLPSDPPECRKLGATGTLFLLTCHDDSVKRCIHYNFSTKAERDAMYARCAGLTSRSVDRHACPSGEVGGGLCRKLVSAQNRDTMYYSGTVNQRRDDCRKSGGEWASR